MDNDFETALVEESEMIQSAIKRYGSEVLLEDKSFDLIAAIVYNKINSFTGEDDDAKESGGVTFGGVLMFLVTTISVVYMLIMICQWLGIRSSATTPFGFSFGSSEKKDTSGSIMAGQFEFKSGDQINVTSFFGREDLFSEWGNRVIDSIKKIATRPKSSLDKLAIYQQLNFVLFGPPGTGKTFFVQTLATRTDFKLKKLYLEEFEAKKYQEMKKKPESEFNEYVNKTPSRIRFCEVQPGVINSKFIGEAEKNVALLFEEAKKLLSGKWQAVFLFFDEGDVFFDKRVSGASASASGFSTGNVKSELLTRIGVRPTNKYRPLFVFSASNRMEEFDDAFKRRFANQKEFGFPNVAERRNFIESLLLGFNITNEEIAFIVTYTERKSYSYISEKMKLFMKTDSDSDEFTQLEFRKYMEFLKRNHSNRNMV